MGGSAVEVTALPPQVEDIDPTEAAGPQQITQQSNKDQERSRKAKYRADAKGISGELRGLQGTGIPATEKESKKLELKQRKKTLNQEFRQEKKRSKDQKKLKSKEEAQERAARKKIERERTASIGGNKEEAEEAQDVSTPPSPESITTQPEPTL
ncbi:MAG: hypothetical protein M1813_006548 [Trichoglossum hirsutum]|nr:MAG: hypothetical protein M1813_006548 [Trichoglossum hirsutum]